MKKFFIKVKNDKGNTRTYKNLDQRKRDIVINNLKRNKQTVVAEWEVDEK